MCFNKDCARDILLYVKKNCCFKESDFGKRWYEVSFDELCKSEQFSKYEMETISYTITILLDYQLIKQGKNKYKSYIDDNFENIHINNLTSKGHEFIDNVTSEELWNKVKIAIQDAGINDCSLNVYFDYIYNETKKVLNN